MTDRPDPTQCLGTTSSTEQSDQPNTVSRGAGSEPARQRGRRPSPGSDRKKNSITVRFSDSEYEHVRRLSRDAQIAPWLRSVALDEPRPVIFPPDVIEIWRDATPLRSKVERILDACGGNEISPEGRAQINELIVSIDALRFRILGQEE